MLRIATTNLSGLWISNHPINYNASRMRGEIVLEAKLTIKSEKQAEHDKGQAKAYARLLQARVIVLVAQEGIWLADEHDDYNHMKRYSWGELQDSDTFLLLLAAPICRVLPGFARS